jgi:hypothetical protein
VLARVWEGGGAVEADAAELETSLDCIVVAVGDVDGITAAAMPGRLHVEVVVEPEAATSMMVDDCSTLQFLDIMSYEEEETLSWMMWWGEELTSRTVL